jgi:hypothetical protein
MCKLWAQHDLEANKIHALIKELYIIARQSLRRLIVAAE